MLNSALRRLGLDADVSGLRNYLYDFRRFKAASGAFNSQAPKSVAARITKEYHRLEKGLALPDIRPGFGQTVLDYLLEAVPSLEAARGPCLATRGARGAMASYVAYHDGIGAEIREDLRRFVESDGEPGLPGGIVELTRDQIAAATDFDYAAFVGSRYSVRQFTGNPVPMEAVREAVDLALKTPRVCNRESRRVYVAHGAAATEVLSYQNGNRGFGHLAGAVLIITSDMRHFLDLGERNQCWIDGGMFAMSLAYAFHAKGLGTCMLNWSAVFWRDRAMRRALGIPDHEAVITFMAVGHPTERLVLAQSPRPEAEAVMRTIPAPAAPRT